MAAVLVLCAVPATVTAYGQVELDGAVPDVVVVDMADLHSAYDRYPAITAAAEALSERHGSDRVLFLINGDLFELGNVAAVRSEGLVDWAFLERLRSVGRVVINVGNHEFDFLSPEEFVRKAEDLNITVIGTVGTVENPRLIRPTVDLTVSGRRLRIVGIGTDQLNTYPEPLRERLAIPHPVEWGRSAWSDAAAGADYVILASHAGLGADRRIMGAVAESGGPAPLYAVGGHDHLTVRDTLSGVPYRHNGFRGELMDVTEVFFTPVGARLRSARVDVEALSTEDAALARLVTRVREAVLEEDDLRVVGTVPTEMSVVEAALWSAETVRIAVGADAAFLNHTSFGSGLAAGTLPRYRFDQFMRFDNDVMRAEVDGATLRTILSRANQHVDMPLAERGGDFLYGSGPVVNVTGGIREDRTYTIVTSSWVALDFNQERYLGTTVAFEQVPNVTTKGLLTAAMNR